MGSNLPKIAEGIRSGRIKTLIVSAKTSRSMASAPDLLGKLELLIVSDILPNETTALRALSVAWLRPRGKARHIHQHAKAACKDS